MISKIVNTHKAKKNMTGTRNLKFEFFNEPNRISRLELEINHFRCLSYIHTYIHFNFETHHSGMNKISKHSKDHRRNHRFIVINVHALPER